MRVRPRPVSGVHDDTFWHFVDERQLHLQRCLDCSHLRYPPAGSCPSCLSFHAIWEPIAGNGQVLAWTTFQRQYFPMIPPPHTVVAVMIEEGPIVVADLDVESERPALNQAASLSYEECEDEEGRRWTLYHWRIE